MTNKDLQKAQDWSSRLNCTTFCEFPGCKRYRQHKDGYCLLHHTQLRRKGKTHAVGSKSCSISGCLYDAEVRGLCYLHYRKTAPQKFKANEWQKQYQANCPEEARRRRKDRTLQREYDITLNEYEILWNIQGGNCAICKKPETEVNQRIGKPKQLSVDHDHKTGKIRGLLCKRCNQGLGLFQENSGFLLNAYSYLEGSGD
jgi:hypothetical protein